MITLKYALKSVHAEEQQTVLDIQQEEDMQTLRNYHRPAHQHVLTGIPEGSQLAAKRKRGTDGLTWLSGQYWHKFRTANPVECIFSTVHHRARRSEDYLLLDGILHMMLKISVLR